MKEVKAMEEGTLAAETAALNAKACDMNERISNGYRYFLNKESDLCIVKEAKADKGHMWLTFEMPVRKTIPGYDDFLVRDHNGKRTWTKECVTLEEFCEFIIEPNRSNLPYDLLLLSSDEIYSIISRQRQIRIEKANSEYTDNLKELKEANERCH